MSSTSQQVDDQAARWAALCDLSGLTLAQQEEFEQWLEADRRHLGAYARAEGALIRVQHAQGWIRDMGSALEPIEITSRIRRRLFLMGGVATSAAAVGIFGVGLWRTSREQIFSTGKGEVREVLLADGSVVKLNTNSKVKVQYTSEMRNVHLLEGEALFDVAKNKARPFVVQANDTLVRAVGTSFTVSVLPKQPVQVLVKEGVVEVKRNIALSTPVRVIANERALAPHGAPITAVAVAQEKLARDMAWENGRIAFDDETLQAAANEYARYSDIQIVVDPAIAKMTITGSFVSNDPVGFSRAAAGTLGLQVEVNGLAVKIFRRFASTR